MSDNDLILYTSDDGESQFILRELRGVLFIAETCLRVGVWREFLNGGMSEQIEDNSRRLWGK